MDGRKDDRRIDGAMDTPTDGRTVVWVRVVVDCGNRFGWSNFSACSSFSAGKVTGCFSPGGSSTPFCFRLVTLGGGGLWAGRIGFVAGISCFTASTLSPEPLGSGETSCTGIAFSFTLSLLAFF